MEWIAIKIKIKDIKSNNCLKRAAEASRFSRD